MHGADENEAALRERLREPSRRACAKLALPVLEAAHALGATCPGQRGQAERLSEGLRPHGKRQRIIPCEI
jgi:hypothetical protein